MCDGVGEIQREVARPMENGKGFTTLIQIYVSKNI